MKKNILMAAVAMSTALAMNAEGYQINTLSAKQEGMGHVGVAMKLGTESQFFNPAGLAFMDGSLDISGSFTAIDATAKATIDGTAYKTNNDISTPIAMGAAFRIYDNLKAGVAFYTPYGSGIKWGDNWAGSVLNQRVDLKVYTLQPTISWKVTPKLSIGAGAMISWGSVDLSKGLVESSTMDVYMNILEATGALEKMGIDPTYRFNGTTPASVTLNGKSKVAVGLNVGAMYDITNNLTIGAQFRSHMAMKVDCGDASLRYANATARTILESSLHMIDEANFKAEMPCPYTFAFGVSYRPIDKLTLALDAQLTGWKTYKQLDITFLDSQLTGFNQHIEKNYSNAWAVKFGAQYGLTDRFDIRAGMMIDTTPVNEHFYNPETPGMTKLNPSVGFSFRPVKGLSVDAAFVYVAGLGRDGASCTYPDLLANQINAAVPAMNLPPTQTFTANYNVHAFIPSIGVSYTF